MSENGCLQNTSFNNVEIKDNIIYRNPVSIEGPKRQFSVINQSLVGIDGSSSAFSDNDVLLELGSLNIHEATSDYPLAQQILIKDVVIMVHQGAGTTLTGHIDISSNYGIAVNEAISGNTEIVGAGATYVSQTLETVGTETDINLNSVGITSLCPNIVITDTQKIYVYLVTTTTLSTAVSQGKISIFMEYYVL